MKKDDQEFNEFLRKEKAYYEQQKSKRPSILNTTNKNINFKTMNQDNKQYNYKSSYRSSSQLQSQQYDGESSSAQFQQHNLKYIMQDDLNNNNDNINNVNKSSNILINPMISQYSSTQYNYASTPTEKPNKLNNIHSNSKQDIIPSQSQSSNYKFSFKNLSSTSIDNSKFNKTIANDFQDTKINIIDLEKDKLTQLLSIKEQQQQLQLLQKYSANNNISKNNQSYEIFRNNSLTIPHTATSKISNNNINIFSQITTPQTQTQIATQTSTITIGNTKYPTNSNNNNILKRKRNSMQNTIFLTPMHSRAETPTTTAVTQFVTKNDISIENGEAAQPKTSSSNHHPHNIQKSLNQLNITTQQIQKLQQSIGSSKNTLSKIISSTHDSPLFNKQSQSNIFNSQNNLSLPFNRLGSSHKIPNQILSDKTIQLESSILPQNKVEMMEQLKIKCNNNFYGKFIQHALSQDITSNQKDNINSNTQYGSFTQTQSQQQLQLPQQQSQSSLSPSKRQFEAIQKVMKSNQNSPRISTPYETNLATIKSKLSTQLLELIKSDFYGSKDNEDDSQQQDFSPQREWKFQKLKFPKQEEYEKRFEKISREIINKREKSEQLKEKLFEIIQSKEKIVVHTSQNKDLMNISERKDIINLAQWYEYMLNSIYHSSMNTKNNNSMNNSQTTNVNSNKNNNDDCTYSQIFSDLQALHQACISEIIRQVSIHSVERGQLLKKVNENLSALLREAFTRQLDEKVAFQKDVHKEIQNVHRDCIEKIDYYIPLISTLTEQLEKKDAINKRILLEFRYLKKKNHKLEKFLKEGRKEYKTLQTDYKSLNKQLDDIKQLHAEMTTKQKLDQSKMSDQFKQQLEFITQQAIKNSETSLNKMKSENQMLKELQAKYENEQKQMSTQFKITQIEIDELEEISQKQEFSNNNNSSNYTLNYISSEKQQSQMENNNSNRNNQSQKQLNFESQTQYEIEEEEQKESYPYYQQQQPDSDNIQSTERQIIEIEGLDGLKFVLASVGVQVGNDLIQRKDVETQIQCITNTIETQTNQDPPKILSNISCQTPIEWMKQKENEKQEKTKNTKRSQKLDEENENKKISLIYGKEISNLKLEGLDRFMTDSPVHRYMSTPESVNKFTFFMEAISDDKVELKSEDDDDDDGIEGIEKDNSVDASLDRIVDIIEKNQNSKDKQQQLDKQSQDQYSASLKFKQTLENTLRASIENDISDLHLILHSKQRFVLDVFQKIIDHQLLIQNPHLNYNELQLFISDSLAFKQEENLRFRNIWNKCKLQLIQYVKSKISLAEKEVEIEEANKNLDFGNNLYEKLITEYQNVLEQISSNSKRIDRAKRSSISKESSNSMNSIILETIDDEEHTTTNQYQEQLHSSSPNRSPQVHNKSDLLDVNSKNHKTQSLRSSFLQNTNNSNSNNNTNDHKTQSSNSKGRRQTTQVIIKPKKNKDQKLSINTKSDKNQTEQNKIKEFNNNNKEDTTIIIIDEDSILDKSQLPQNQQLQQTQNSNQLQPKSKNKQKFSKVVSMVMNSKNKLSSKQSLSNTTINTINNEQPDTISDDIIQRQIISQKDQTFDLFKNFRFKKHKLRKKYGLQSSPNQDAASNFVQTIGIKIMNTRNKKSKIAVFTEQNTRKYISSIYNDKIKQIKSQDKSNPLHNVAYDFFLNKFGFKNLAEKNLQQFLRSLQYHSHLERVRIFLCFFGIDHQINYDIDDFNFYINCLISLDENLPPLFQQFFVYSIPKVSELLFKKFENKITNKILNKIKSDIESMKYQTNDPALKNKNVIDQDQALQCLLSAKVEEKKVNIIALRPIYLAGDVDNDQVIGNEINLFEKNQFQKFKQLFNKIGYDEFMMLTRHIERGMSQLSIMQLFFYNTDMIDEITNEKTMSFQQFAQISVENNLFNFEKQQKYLSDIEEWDQIKNIQNLKKQWNQKKDILRLRFVKTNSYKNFYRLMIQKIEDYFQQAQMNPQYEQYLNQQRPSLTKLSQGQQQSGSLLQLQSVPTQNSHTSLMNIEELNYSPHPVNSNGDRDRGLGKSLKSQNQIPAQVLQQIDQEEQEKQNVTWLLYKLLDDESKRVIIDSQIEQLIPSTFLSITNTVEYLASENKFFQLSHKNNNNNNNNKENA